MCQNYSSIHCHSIQWSRCVINTSKVKHMQYIPMWRKNLLDKYSKHNTGYHYLEGTSPDLSDSPLQRCKKQGYINAFSSIEKGTREHGYFPKTRYVINISILSSSVIIAYFWWRYHLNVNPHVKIFILTHIFYIFSIHHNRIWSGILPRHLCPSGIHKWTMPPSCTTKRKVSWGETRGILR